MDGRRRWRNPLLVLAVVVLAIVGGGSCETKNIGQVEPEEPQCLLDPGASLDFGAPTLGTYSEATLQIRNGSPADAYENRFAYEMILPSNDEDCGEFSFPYGGRAGMVGPGGWVDISLRFAPDAARPYLCQIRLNALKVQNGHQTIHLISDPCPSPLAWAGIGTPRWEECMGDGDFGPLHGVNSGVGSVVAVGDAGTVLRKGTGCSWTKIDIAPVEAPTLGLRDVWGWGDPLQETHVLWAVGTRSPPPGQYGNRGAILRFDVNGWTQPSEGWLITYGSVWGSGFDDVWFVGQGVATDFPNARHWNGSTLDSLLIDLGMSELTGVHGTGSEDVWAVLKQPSYSVHHFDGSAWEDRTEPFMDQPLYDVWTTATGHVYAVGADGAIYHYDNGTWTDESIRNELRDFYGVWADEETGFAVVVGEGGAIYHFNGSEWSQQSLTHLDVEVGSFHDVFGVHGDQGIEVWAVGEGDRGVILRLGFVP